MYTSNMKRIVRLTESDLHRIVKESVNMFLNEDDDMDKDNIIKTKALEALKNAGFTNIFGDNGWLTFNVSINSINDINAIRKILINAVKPKDYEDLSVTKGYGMTDYCKISLPAWTHSNLF